MPNALHRVHKAHLTFTAVFPCTLLAHIEPFIHQNPQAESPYPVLTCSSSPPTLPLSHPLSKCYTRRSTWRVLTKPVPP